MHSNPPSVGHGLYLHVPFCKSRCIYCGFFSTTAHELRQAYTDAVCREITLRRCDRLSSVYLGGGTPSQLSQPQLRQIFDTIATVYPGFASGPTPIEITMECNPDDITESFAAFLSTLPVNRVSMGVQTFSDERLRFLHRRHHAHQAHSAVRLLRDHGIKNISIDLMFGFPDESIASWETDLDEALSLHVEHISAYSLMYEEGTPLYRLLEQGEIDDLDEDTYIKMYDLLVSRLRASGYEHYEISNFALPGKRSRHNSSYWNDVPYIGIGASAHSYDGRRREWNVSDLHQYITAINNGGIPSEYEEIDAVTHYNDQVTTRLRTAEGIDLLQLREELGDFYHDYLLENAAVSIDTGLMIIENGHLHLTLDGIHVSDLVMSDLVYVPST